MQQMIFIAYLISWHFISTY